MRTIGCFGSTLPVDILVRMRGYQITCVTSPLPTPVSVRYFKFASCASGLVRVQRQWQRYLLISKSSPGVYQRRYSGVASYGLGHSKSLKLNSSCLTSFTSNYSLSPPFLRYTRRTWDILSKTVTQFFSECTGEASRLLNSRHLTKRLYHLMCRRHGIFTYRLRSSMALWRRCWNGCGARNKHWYWYINAQYLRTEKFHKNIPDSLHSSNSARPKALISRYLWTKEEVRLTWEIAIMYIRVCSESREREARKYA